MILSITNLDILYMSIYLFNYLYPLGSMVLSISILDINDNAPVFSVPEYSATLNETSPTGAYVIQVKDDLKNNFCGYFCKEWRVNPLFAKRR